MFSMYVIAVAVAIAVLAGCSIGGAQTFPEPCAIVTGVGSVARHDFGTTDPTVVARVFAVEENVQVGGPGVPGGIGTITSEPIFLGTVAQINCPQPTTENVIFVLEAP